MEAGEIEPAGALPGEKEGLSIAQPALERKNKDRRGEEGLNGRTRGDGEKQGRMIFFYVHHRLLSKIFRDQGQKVYYPIKCTNQLPLTTVIFNDFVIWLQQEEMKRPFCLNS